MVLTAPTMREGLETFVRYSALLNDGRRWEIAKDSKHLSVTLVESCPRVLGVRLSHETAFAQLVRAVRQLSGGGVGGAAAGDRIDPLSVDFVHRAPSDLRAHHALFRCTLRFGSTQHDRIVFARDPFESAPAAGTGNHALWKYLCARADEATAQLAPRPLVERVRDEVQRAVAAGLTLEMTAVAQTLGTTERTLRRTLAASKVSFRQLVDDTRRSHALELLSSDAAGSGSGSGSARSSLTRIAFDVGFSDTSAFTHACRRWFGHAPRDVVRMHRRRSSSSSSSSS